MSLKPKNKSLHEPALELTQCIESAKMAMLKQRHTDGYWWYTLEANDAINAEFLFLLKYINVSDTETEQAICRWLVNNQNADGSWSLYHEDGGDLSCTVECYTALKLCGFDTNAPVMVAARKYILSCGGITKVRVFTRIHLALLGLVSWSICPNMPVGLMQFPEWAPVNIYEFSSWARASIVPLLVVMDQKKSLNIPDFHVNELYKEKDTEHAEWEYEINSAFLSIQNIFLKVDKALRVVDKLKLQPLRKASLKKCEQYIREHLETTEDIYPAMFYGILALDSLGYNLEDSSMQKAFLGLKSFQVITSHKDLPAVPFQDSSTIDYNVINKEPDESYCVYQQCCISPVWDTAWAGVALLKAGMSPSDPNILQTAKWLLSKQITDVVGDWAIKNPGVEPGGWSFEFHNKHYPDLDDTIEVMTFLHGTDLSYRELKQPFERGLKWLLSMQCKNGGFAAFDKDNDLELLNKIPFSDHGACLDQATVDITGRMIEFLVGVCGYGKESFVIQRAANFIIKNQERDGSFWGRWGVNYLYGTWCALEALCLLGRKRDKLTISRAIHWLKSVQRPDGGFGESCLSYEKNGYVDLGTSTASQTAWALLGFVAAGLKDSPEAKRAAQFLVASQNAEGTWDEAHFTGTGFPGHFYIRYHGYRHYFPLLALSKYGSQPMYT